MEKLEPADTLVVQQRKEWGEILTGFETKNKYSVMSASGDQLYWAAEESSFLLRMFLKAYRPFTIHILSSQGNTALRLNKPFRFYFHQIDVVDSNGRQLGTIRREFSIFTRRFTVMGPMGNEIYRIFGPLFHPWTFQILKSNVQVGIIAKKWSGLGKEMFTDADNFNITFPPDIDVNQKGVLLGALFLIDMLHFERK